MVFQAKNIKSDEQVALKFVSRESLNNKEFLENFEKEQRIYSRLKHKNITRYIETIYTQDYIIIVQELLTSGTLTQMFGRYHNLLNETLILRWAKQILEGIAYLHSHGIAHCDIKPENIGFDSCGHPKLFDFGLCTDNLRTKSYKCGTPLFAAPEVFDENPHDEFKADIWSFGVTIYNMVTGCFPFETDDFDVFLTERYKPHFMNIKCKGIFNDLMHMTLKIDPKQRWTAEEILKSHIFQNVKDKNENSYHLIPSSRSKSISRPSYKRPTIHVPKVTTLSSRIMPCFSV